MALFAGEAVAAAAAVAAGVGFRGELPSSGEAAAAAAGAGFRGEVPSSGDGFCADSGNSELAARCAAAASAVMLKAAAEAL